MLIMTFALFAALPLYPFGDCLSPAFICKNSRAGRARLCWRPRSSESELDRPGYLPTSVDCIKWAEGIHAYIS